MRNYRITNLLRGQHIMLLLLWLLPEVLGYNCIEHCDSDGRLVSRTKDEQECLISMPDNPLKADEQIRPCQIQIMSNCTEFCHVELNFAKFNLPECTHNVSHETDSCDLVNSCEYIVLREIGEDIYGTPNHYATSFHGYKTNQKYVSRTDQILLQFCYRSETFSARNIQVEYRAIIPESAKPVNYGPPSVYVLCTLVVFFMLAIVAVRWCSWLRPCLDPPSPEKSPSFNV